MDVVSGLYKMLGENNVLRELHAGFQFRNMPKPVSVRTIKNILKLHVIPPVIIPFIAAILS